MSVMNTGIVNWMLQTAATYGGVVLTFILARHWLVERLFGHYVELRLTNLKHEQNSQIEALKEQLAHLGDRGKRSNEREFEALSAVWDKFVEAFLSTMSCAISFLSHPDLERMTDDDLNSFLSTTELSEMQKTQVRQSTTKNRVYARIMSFRQIIKAGTDIYDARLLLRKNGIFIPPDLSNQISSAIESLSRAQTERYLDEQHSGRSGFTGEATTALISNGNALFDELQASVRTRLLRA
jgi:hypothetical protein